MTVQENSGRPATLLAPGSLGFRGSWAIPLKNHLAIERVVSELYAPVYRFALVLAESETEAADLTQETFLILCRQYEQVREPEKIKSWLFTTLRRMFFRTLRKRQARPEVELHPQHQEPAVDPTAPRSVDAGTILGALSQLEENQRTVLELFYLADLSYKEISSTLKIPIGTVMSRLARAKERLKSTLTERSSPERPVSEVRKTHSRFESGLRRETEIRKYESSYSGNHRLTRANRQINWPKRPG